MATKSHLYVGYRLVCHTEDIGGSESASESHGRFAAHPDWRSSIDGFRALRIVRVEHRTVYFENLGRAYTLTPDVPIVICTTIDGYEDHEGVVWSTDSYALTLYIE